MPVLQFAVDVAPVVVPTGLVGLWLIKDDRVVSKMRYCFSRGGKFDWHDEFADVDSRATVARDDVLEQLQHVLRPTGPVSKYATIVGVPGTGKSVAIRKAIRSIGYPAGVEYTSAPIVASHYPQTLADAFRDFEPLVRFPWRRGPVDSVSEWHALERLLLQACRDFRDKHKCTAVLVVDAAERIVEQDPLLFSRMQEFAKECAQTNTLRFVFVFSGGTPPPLFKQSSAASHALPPVEVGDIPDAAAISYLMSAYGKDEETAKAIVANIGGRFTLLQELGESQMPLDEWRDTRFVQVNTIIVRLGLNMKQVIFRYLLDARRGLRTDRAVALLESGKLEALLKHNIIAEHSDSTYSFHDRFIADCFRPDEPKEAKQQTGV